MSYTLHNLNEGSDDSEANVSGPSTYSHAGMMGCKRSADDAGLEQEGIGISSDDDGMEKPDPPKKIPPPNGKKTKGRVKIKMEFIDNKLRRYTTFSKRKTGIMKKAYELSTLTGTQVMLLVASETGHVYTFATRKLQPMITSEAGKALIQTCLNSPDPPLGPSQQLDQRMSATGFEETDLTYSISEEDQKEGKVQVTFRGGSPIDSSSSQMSSTSQVTSSNVTTLLSTQTPSSAKPTNISMHLPTAGYAAILTPGTLSHGTPLQLAAANVQTQQHQHSSQTLYRIPQQSLVSIPGIAQAASNQSNNNPESQNTVTVVPTTQSSLSVMSGNVVIPTPAAVVSTTSNSIPGTVMYQTAQGVVYATPTTATLPEGVIFNFGQAPATLQIPQEQGGNPTHQQYITIPVPVSLTAAPQIVQSQQVMSPTTSSSSNSEPSSSP